MDQETALKLKNLRRKQLLENNPNAVLLEKKDYLDIIDILIDNPYIQLNDIKHHSFSLYIKRKMIQEIFDTTHIQKFRQQCTNKEIKHVLDKKKKYYENME